MEKNTVKAVLDQIKNEQGLEILNASDTKKFNSMLSDALGIVVPAKLEQDNLRNLLKIALVDMKAYKKLKSAKGESEQAELLTLIEKMTESFKFQRETVAVIIGCIAETLDYAEPFPNIAPMVSQTAAANLANNAATGGSFEESLQYNEKTAEKSKKAAKNGERRENPNWEEEREIRENSQEKAAPPKKKRKFLTGCLLFLGGLLAAVVLLFVLFWFWDDDYDEIVETPPIVDEEVLVVAVPEEEEDVLLIAPPVEEEEDEETSEEIELLLIGEDEEDEEIEEVEEEEIAEIAYIEGDVLFMGLSVADLIGVSLNDIVNAMGQRGQLDLGNITSGNRVMGNFGNDNFEVSFQNPAITFVLQNTGLDAYRLHGARTAQFRTAEYANFTMNGYTLIDRTRAELQQIIGSEPTEERPAEVSSSAFDLVYRFEMFDLIVGIPAAEDNVSQQIFIVGNVDNIDFGGTLGAPMTTMIVPNGELILYLSDLEPLQISRLLGTSMEEFFDLIFSHTTTSQRVYNRTFYIFEDSISNSANITQLLIPRDGDEILAITAVEDASTSGFALAGSNSRITTNNMLDILGHPASERAVDGYNEMIWEFDGYNLVILQDINYPSRYEITARLNE
ncbi:MAG: hypothetical protein FWG64_07920 [Firmicutes bacterium]|nr:hypothetical protein [Bacillota bacterium]